jgi:hypothetical protein
MESTAALSPSVIAVNHRASRANTSVQGVLSRSGAALLVSLHVSAALRPGVAIVTIPARITTTAGTDATAHDQNRNLWLTSHSSPLHRRGSHTWAHLFLGKSIAVVAKILVFPAAYAPRAIDTRQ